MSEQDETKFNYDLMLYGTAYKMIVMDNTGFTTEYYVPYEDVANRQVEEIYLSKKEIK